MGRIIYVLTLTMVIVLMEPMTMTMTTSTSSSSHVCGVEVVEDEEIETSTITYPCTVIVEEKCSGIWSWLTDKMCNVSKPAKCNRTETVVTVVNVTVDACCEGWTKDASGHCILPFCVGGCGDAGTCLMVDGVPTCVCRDGYQGEHCQLSMEVTTVSWSETGARVIQPHWTDVRVGLTAALTLAALITTILVVIYIYCLLRRRRLRLRMDTLGLIDRQRNIYVTSEDMKRSSEDFDGRAGSFPHVVYAVSGPLGGAQTNLAFTNDDVTRNRQSIISEDIYTEVDESGRGVIASHDAEGYLQARISTGSTPSTVSLPSRTTTTSVTSRVSDTNHSIRSQNASVDSVRREESEIQRESDPSLTQISERTDLFSTEDNYEVSSPYAEPTEVTNNYAVIQGEGEELDTEQHDDDSSVASFEHDYHYIPSRMTPDSIVACSASESEPVAQDIQHAYDYIPHINLSDSDHPYALSQPDGQQEGNFSAGSNTHALAAGIWDSDSDIVSITDSLEDDYDHVSPRGKYRENIVDCTLSDISDLDDLEGSVDNSYDFIPSAREGMPYLSAGSDSVFGQISGELEHDYEMIPDRKLTYRIATPPDAQSTPVKTHRTSDDPVYVNLPDLLVGAASMDSMPFDSLEENGIKSSGDIIDVLKSAPISRQSSQSSAYADVELTTGNTAEMGHISENVYESRITLADVISAKPENHELPLNTHSNSVEYGYSKTLDSHFDSGGENLYEIMNDVCDSLEPDSLDFLDNSSPPESPVIIEEVEQKTLANVSPLSSQHQSKPEKTRELVTSSGSPKNEHSTDGRWRVNDSLDCDTSFSSTDDDSDYEHVCTREAVDLEASNRELPPPPDMPAVHRESPRISKPDIAKRSLSHDRDRVHFGDLQFDKRTSSHVDSEV